MTLQERMEEELDIDLTEAVFTITFEDVAYLLTDNLTEEKVAAMSPEEISLAVKGVLSGFDHMDWYDWGSSGLEALKGEHPQLFDEEEDE